MILLLFFCSGATALIYEVVWSKYLSLLFGSTIYAQTVVLAVFMGGLALGNRLIGARSDLLLKPLGAYGKLEVLIGLYAFAFSFLHQVAERVFVSVGSNLIDRGGWLLLLKGTLAVGLLLLPTVLMGGTLPLLAAWLQKNSKDAGRWTARFYSINSLGAVAGACLAGFFMIRSLGLVSTLQVTGLVNVIVGFAAIGLERKRKVQGEVNSTVPVPTTEVESTPTVLSTRWVTLLVGLAGGVSMGLEVLASRSLTLIFGASLQAFAIVLMSFILGIGLGSAAVASPRLKRWQSPGLIFGLLLSAAAIVGVLVLGIELWVEAYRHMVTGLGRTPMGYRFYQIFTGGFSMVILGLPAALIGAVLPLCIRLVSARGETLGDSIGRLLTWNTLGAVVGVLLTGFVLMPKAGLRNAFNLLALLLCVAVFIAAWREKKKAFFGAAALLASGLILSCIAGGEGWKYVLSSGVFRSREVVVDPTEMVNRKKFISILFYEDAADATVSVEKQDMVGGENMGLRISGKPEASTRGDLSTQLLMAHLPMLMRPESKEIFVLGLASGITASGFLTYPIERLTIAENCAPVVKAAQFFTPWNRGVLTNPVTHLKLEDARTVLKLEKQMYDVVVSEPSNPWFASVGSVFSREYYQLASARLKPGGLMVQWFHVYEMHDGILEMALRTFQTVFPHTEIWDANDGDMIFIGSDRPWNYSIEELSRSLQREGVQQDLASIGLGTPEALLARQFASQRTAFAISGNGPIQTDGFPVLEYDAPLAFFIGTTASKIARFDERTWQSPLASQEKRAALLSLSDSSIRAAFSNSTMNVELRQAINRRLQGRPPSASTRVSLGDFPSLFDMPVPIEEKSQENETTDLKQLLRARASLQREGENWAEQVQTIRRILLAQLADTTKRLDPRTAHFAGVASRTCMVHGQLDLAGELLVLGFKFLPNEPELAYLARVLEREQVRKASSKEFGASVSKY
jgi:spermidine synthase